MTPKHKIDAVKRSVMGMKESAAYSKVEQLIYFTGMRNACRILVGDNAGVTKLLNLVIEQEVKR